MHTPSSPSIALAANNPPGIDPLDAHAVLACARMLLHAPKSGGPHRLLRGRNLGLLCADEHAPAQQQFRDAAAELGAHVAVIRADLTHASSPEEIGHMARMLSRLYDAVECNGLPPSLTGQLARSASIPVMSGHVATPDQVDVLAGMLDGAEPWQDKRRCVMQALVLRVAC
jgi:ornithine carbamoyltransferase